MDEGVRQRRDGNVGGGGEGGKCLFPARLHHAGVGNGRKCLCVRTCSCCFSIIGASVDQSVAMGHKPLIVFK